jgi:putative redox protein
MSEHLEVTVELMNEKVRFIGMSLANPDCPIIFDFPPPLGDGQGYTGLELLLLSFAGCSATTILYLLRRMGKSISRLTAIANGIGREQPPLGLEKIIVEYDVHSSDTAAADIEKALQLAEEAYCPVWQMVKNNVEITVEYRLVAS